MNKLNKFRKYYIQFITILILVFSLQSFGQTSNAKLKEGISIAEQKTALTESDLNLINSYNFDNYRRYDRRAKVQLLNGPLLELHSILEIQKLGFELKPEIIEAAKNQDWTNVKHESIPLLNIGLGITKLDILH